MAQFALHVNGAVRTIEADGNMPLLWALRDLLELTGTKYGCGIGMCGACTIHLDGSPVRSCQTSVAGVGSRKITTIEGLGKNGLHPVQKAWIAEQVPQCGYCQSGQIMSAAALLASTRIRRTHRSMMRWLATSAAAPPTSGFAKPFSVQRRRSGHENQSQGFSRHLCLAGWRSVCDRISSECRCPGYRRRGKNGEDPFDAWIHIKPDSNAELVLAQSEMGQGVYTSLPMLFAEEADLDWERVKVVQSDSTKGTGGSGSVRSNYLPLRRAGSRCAGQ